MSRSDLPNGGSRISQMTGTPKNWRYHIPVIHGSSILNPFKSTDLKLYGGSKTVKMYLNVNTYSSIVSILKT